MHYAISHLAHLTFIRSHSRSCWPRRMDYAVVHHACSTLQVQSAEHNFDSQRLHIEAKPNNPGCKGLPSASWSVVLIFNSAEQCLAARKYLEKARLELLDKRAKLVAQVVVEEGGPDAEEESKGEEEEVQPELVAAPETDAPPVDAPAAGAEERDEASGD
jgi:hypothetical protein